VGRGATAVHKEELSLHDGVRERIDFYILSIHDGSVCRGGVRWRRRISRSRPSQDLRRWRGIHNSGNEIYNSGDEIYNGGNKIYNDSPASSSAPRLPRSGAARPPPRHGAARPPPWRGAVRPPPRRGALGPPPRLGVACLPLTRDLLLSWRLG
jgi:hypothetical protein